MILQLTKILHAEPALQPVSGVAIRNYQGASDIGSWLALRHRAFGRETVGVRSWSERDFAAEFLDRPWWSPTRLWLAEQLVEESPTGLVGAVALAERDSHRPAVHWLMVDPAYRRRGVAAALMAVLENWCWQAGHRQIWLETHSAWQAAARLYRKMGYVEALFRGTVDPAGASES